MTFVDLLVCNEAAVLAGNTLFLAITFFKTAMLVTGLFTVAWLRLAIGTTWLLSRNSRFFFQVHLFFTITSTSLALINYAFDSVRLSLYHSDPCDYLLSGPFAFLLIVAYCTSDCCQLLLILCLALERLGATLRPLFFESLQTSTLAAFTSLICATFGIAFSALMLIPGVDYHNMTAAFSVVTKENEKRYRVFKLFEFALELVSLVIFILVLLFNRGEKDRYANNLRLNYQIKENRKVTRLLLPLFFFHFIVYSINHFGISVMLALTGGFSNSNTVQMAIVVELPGWTCMYAVLMPLLLWLLRVRAERRRRRVTSEQQRNEFIPVQQLFKGPKEDNTNTKKDRKKKNCIQRIAQWKIRN